jgi:hypothetical protein
MLTGEMAKYQIQYRIRSAEQDRSSRRAMAASEETRTPVVRRVGSGLLAAVVGPRRKAIPTSSMIEAGLAR